MVEKCFHEPDKEIPGAYILGSHVQPFYAQWLLLCILTPNIIIHAGKNPKLSVPHGEEANPRKTSMYHYKHKETIPKPLTEYNVKNCIYGSRTEQYNK